MSTRRADAVHMRLGDPCAAVVSLLVVFIVGIAAGSARAQDAAPPRSAAYDGTWFVSLDCADTQDRSGMVKGYHFAFDARIVDGRLDGQYGTPGVPASLHFVGDVRDGGVLEIHADGMTGSADYNVGRGGAGTPYAYTMGGWLDGARGEALRREVRPCIARFVKRDAGAR